MSAALVTRAATGSSDIRYRQEELTFFHGKNTGGGHGLTPSARGSGYSVTIFPLCIPPFSPQDDNWSCFYAPRRVYLFLHT